MRIAVAVHLGSVFVSGAAEILDWKIAEVTEGIHEDIAAADGLIVIDGSFSGAIPGDLNRTIADALNRAALAGRPSARIWGCDSGASPYAGWQGRDGDGLTGGIRLRHDGQAEAAVAAVPFLQDASEILVTGAWATRDGSSGCVSDAARALREALPPRIDVRVSENCLFEEYLDGFSIWEEADPEDEGAEP